jgi:hypothetical protein
MSGCLLPITSSQYEIQNCSCLDKVKNDDVMIDGRFMQILVNIYYVLLYM